MAELKIAPTGLKPIQGYLKIAEEHEKRDPAITYWCRFYAVQAGLKIDSKTPENRNFLINMMEWLEKEKKSRPDDETISNDVVAQAHIENYALKLFLHADNEDRAGRFNKNMVKTFYTAGFLYDVVNTFGEPSEEIFRNYYKGPFTSWSRRLHLGLGLRTEATKEMPGPRCKRALMVMHHRKYAKWKSTYIHNCLKNGIVPIAGPMAMEGSEDSSNENQEFENGPSLPSMPSATIPSEPQEPPQAPYPTGGLFNIPSFQPEGFNLPIPGTHAPPSTPNGTSQLSPSTSTANVYPEPTNVYREPAKSGGVELTPEDFQKAQKYCKWAGSALQYEDVPTAVENLQKAIRLLTTGQDP